MQKLILFSIFNISKYIKQHFNFYGTQSYYHKNINENQPKNEF